ncbi:Nucleoporin Nup43 [Takifugu flavidus]|uniref:Nucleoporin Nup43 n=1 Tax=Takifugu flavidus TaxID=433684 RepID=A0A5C6NPI4_9TELE|nr:Nucleoporin Nup43 [Takifugu flavidus]
MESINAKYVSQKISKIRWRPVSHAALQQPDIFVTGSWDNEVDNKISFWSIGNHETSANDDGFEGDPQLLCEQRHKGDVLELQFLDPDRIVTASSTGAVTIFRHHQNNQAISLCHEWPRAHYYPCDNAPCTGVVCSSPEIVTVGEDGRIVVFRADQEGVNRVIENADSSTIHAVTYLRTTEILTVNSIGQLKMWDFRQQSSSPAQILSLSGDRVPLHCVDRHPNQQHIVATGGQDGMLCVWDMRQGSAPFSLMEAHSAESGRNNSTTSRSAMAPAGGNQSLISTWLSGESSKARLETTHMLPSQTLSVNTLDVLGQCLACGTDGEAIFVNRQVPV